MTIAGSDITLQAQSTAAARPSHHPPEELLIDYASGALLESESLLIALHLGMCRDCQAVFNESLAIGGVLLDALTPSKLPPGLLNRTFAALDSETFNKKTASPKAAPGFGSHWPAPLRRYIDGNRLKKWRWMPAGFRALRIPCGDDNSGRVWLMKAPPGRGPFHHNHAQDEWTVVLEGGFSDESGTYGVGDFGYAAAGDAHHPIAEPGEGCVCLILVRATPVYSTLPGRILAPFIRL
jgi:putative transcriptional regulator